MQYYNIYNRIPDKLYHYYSFNDLAKRTLREAYIYLSKPAGFNDTEELTVDLIKSDNLLSLEEAFEGFEVAFYENEKRIDPFENQYKMDQDILNDNAEISKNCEGIYCLTDSALNKEMWDSEDYTSNGKGFCLEFDSNALLDSIDYPPCIFGKVEYVNTREHDINMPPYWEYFHKTMAWENEHEYRYVYSNPLLTEAEREFHFNRNALKCIYLGSALDDENIEELKNIVNTVYDGNVELRKANLP